MQIFLGNIVVYFAVAVGVVWITWRLSRCIKVFWFRTLIRAFAIAFLVTPFVPHGQIEWRTPWPPAGVWVILGLLNGKLPGVEILSILLATLILWLVGLALGTAEKGPKDAP